MLYIFLQFHLCLKLGKDIKEPVRVSKDGFHLKISPVTPANQGEYMCLVKDENTELINMYNITVVGKIQSSLYHTYMHFYLHKSTLKHFDFGYI